MREAHNGKLIRGPAAEFEFASVDNAAETINDANYRRTDERQTKFGLGILKAVGANESNVQIRYERKNK